MTSTGLGRHNSKPILDWDDVEMEKDTPDIGQDLSGRAERLPTVAAQPEPRAEAVPEDKAGSPWSAMRKLFKR
ncbi:hypothetical protein HNQ07_004545 [Deinococcus metalli]|uniref:Uncharacterized protein n=1 Tax=Deinococcus metalli TaxID=1141878 RepID=A0A7W8KJG3_9DEIO|nr:hypothetical protein [Deinococcus metalli]MBB5379035.1 hypothetical protein [Deinococcus metalli]GHF63778.1 hypothetical protein GCM10017781_44620 [Deinococcus metalli]